MIHILTLLAIAVTSVLSTPIADDLIISLPNGKVQGIIYVTDNNKTFYGFQGIPYGVPPLGNLRFEPPQPAKPWEGVFNATVDGYACVSWLNAEVESEDCLNINVYTPALKPAEKLPVMFWIYGGKFIAGNALKSSYGPDFLIEEDVVVVSFNYRLGPFGFLSTGDTAITGNFGLKDQNLALKWAKQNVEYFGGDPDKITIFGESAGAGSASLQILSEKSAGLFRAAIVESGSALALWAVDDNPKAYAVLLAEALSGGEYVNDTQKLKQFLQKKTAQEIIEAADSLKSGPGRVPQGTDLIPTQQAWPVVEAENDDAFLTESPYALLDSGRFNQVPVIIGVCVNEALSLLESLEGALEIAQEYDTNPSSVVPVDLFPNSTDLDAVTKTVQDIYLEEGENFTTNLISLSSYYSDNIFIRATLKTAELTVKYVPVYLYQFSYYGRPIYPALIIDGAEKAGHGAELPFLFKIEQAADLYSYSNSTEQDLLAQNRIVKLWTNFAKFLDPTPEESELLNNVTWPVMSPAEHQFLNINDTLEIRSHLGATYSKWTNIFDIYGRKPYITY